MNALVGLIEEAIQAEEATASGPEWQRAHTDACDWPGDMPGYCNCGSAERIQRRCAADKRQLNRLAVMHANGPEYYENPTLWALIVNSLHDLAASYSVTLTGDEPAPPNVLSHDRFTGVMELGTCFGDIQVQLTPGTGVGFTIAVGGTDGPFFVYDPTAPNSWRGPFSDLDQVDEARRELGAWPVERPAK